MNNNQFETYLKPIPSYIVNNFVQQMMTKDTLNEYYSYINECNFLLNQINTYEQSSLWIKNNYLYFNLNGKIINRDLNNYNDIVPVFGRYNFDYVFHCALLSSRFTKAPSSIV